MELIAAIPTWIVWTFVVCWGAIWGSFSNVVIARLPFGQNVAFPASHCPSCKSEIRWYDNLPILSWLLLRAKCRDCEAKISSRYVWVELLGVVSSVAAFVHASGGFSLWRWYGSPFDVLIAWMFLTYLFIGMLVVCAIDFEHALIPHSLSLTLAALGLVYAVIGPAEGDFRSFIPAADLYSALIGGLAGFGISFLIAFGYRAVTGNYGMGGGDFMLFAVIGIWFGWESLPMLFLLASVQGIVGILVAQRFFPHLLTDASSDEFWESDAPLQRSEKMPVEPFRAPDSSIGTSAVEEPGTPKLGVPFGPFICLAAVEYVFLGVHYLRWLWGA